MKSIAAVIWTLYGRNGFTTLWVALEGGDEAQANLKLLYERARSMRNRALRVSSTSFDISKELKRETKI